MNTTRFTPAQRRALAGDDPVTCDRRTAKKLQAGGQIGPASVHPTDRRLVTAKLMSGPRFPDGAMRR